MTNLDFQTGENEEARKNYISQNQSTIARKKRRMLLDEKRKNKRRKFDTSLAFIYEVFKNNHVTTFNIIHNQAAAIARKKRRLLLDKKRKRNNNKSGEPFNEVDAFLLTEPHMLLPPAICEHCGAKKFEFESKGFCCSDGTVVLKLNDVCDNLYELYTSKTQEAQEFKTNVRIYNSSFAFTSLGVKTDKELCRLNRGIYTYRVQGQVHHTIPQLIPTDRPPAFFQLYFYDTEHELQNRLSFSEQMTTAMTNKISDILRLNPYCQFFRQLGNVSNLKSLKIRINVDSGLDQRVYNAPSSSQVAAILVDDDISSEAKSPHILVTAHNGDFHNIHHYYGCYDPLQYPLLFPFGETGWHQHIPKCHRNQQPNFAERHSNLIHQLESVAQLIATENKNLGTRKGKCVSCREYYCYKLQIRHSHQSLLLHSGRLFQQYVVDMYVKIETTRLDYFRHNQEQIRAEVYQGIMDGIQMGETCGQNVGRRVVLPASFIGGPRDMKKRYLDAMALVHRFGKPDIFLTITCNPNWPEIKQELGPTDIPQDRPDLVSRIFRAKLEELKNDLLKKQILGPIAAYVYVIEFQKRGLPHAHFLLIFKSGAKMINSDTFDRVVSAEIPDPTIYPYLHSLVAKHMMHGPCGALNRNNVCMKKNGKCKSNYPKPFCSETTIGDDSFANYRRRDNNRKCKVRGQYLDNRWVVPYNPYFLVKFDCHINVEICSSIQAVKYLYKYIYKGPDRVSFSVDSTTDDINEIDLFQSGRWISPPEATWRLFGFVLSKIHPHVVSLQLHLPDRQVVTFNDTDDLQDIVNNDQLSQSMLTQYFKMKEHDNEARNLLYRQFPERYVWNGQQKVWTSRKRANVIGRIIAASPVQGERYYLKLLLNHIRGATSFDDLKCINGISVSTFREAALLHGLLNGDENYESCLEEASFYKMPFELRRLFATILAYCSVNNPRLLWNNYKLSMCEDYIHDNYSIVNAELSALQNISLILEPMGKNVNDYSLVDFHVDLDLRDRTAIVIEEELHVNISRDDKEAPEKLNQQQRFAFDLIKRAVFSNEGGLFFVDGPGGTGKTFLYRALLGVVRSENLVALATASSGVAASILPGGRTAHSRFKIPIILSENVVCAVSKQSALANLLKMTKLIIWDEAPMVHRHAIEAVDRLLQDVNDCNSLFGGKVVVFGGDFRQVLPVVANGTRKDVMRASLVNSYLWKHFTKLKLVENMRAQLDTSFADYLLRVGNAIETCDFDGNIHLPSNMVLKYTDETSLERLLEVVFPNINLFHENISQMINRVVLTPKNEHVDNINNMMIEKFPGNSVRYFSYDEPVDEGNTNLQPEFLNMLVPNGIPPHELNLKINCPIILLRNINPTEGLCNGTRLICRQFERNVIDAEIAIGEHAGKRVFLPRIPFITSEDKKNPFSFKRTQFPVRPCFAMTINKAQGQTLDYVGIYLPESVFSHGQLYVALSRARSADCIKVLIRKDAANSSSYHSTKNVVYNEILELANANLSNFRVGLNDI